MTIIFEPEEIDLAIKDYIAQKFSVKTNDIEVKKNSMGGYVADFGEVTE